MAAELCERTHQLAILYLEHTLVEVVRQEAFVEQQIVESPSEDCEEVLASSSSACSRAGSSTFPMALSASATLADSVAKAVAEGNEQDFPAIASIAPAANHDHRRCGEWHIQERIHNVYFQSCQNHNRPRAAQLARAPPLPLPWQVFSLLSLT